MKRTYLVDLYAMDENGRMRWTRSYESADRRYAKRHAYRWMREQSLPLRFRGQSCLVAMSAAQSARVLGTGIR